MREVASLSSSSFASGQGCPGDSSEEHHHLHPKVRTVEPIGSGTKETRRRNRHQLNVISGRLPAAVARHRHHGQCR